MVFISQSVHVSLAARYWNRLWTEAQNRARYGASASIEGLGANWRIEITGPVGERELAAPLAEIKALLDHRCLFTDLPQFADKPSTLENVTSFLAERFLNDNLTALTVHDGESLSCVATAAGLELRMKVMNLTLSFGGRPDESGLMTSRHQVTQAVIEAHRVFAQVAGLSGKEWAQALMENLRRNLPGLVSVRVDLGRGKYIVVG